MADGSNDEAHDILVEIRMFLESSFDMSKPIDGEDSHEMVDWVCELYPKVIAHLEADDVCDRCGEVRHEHNHEFVAG